MYSDVGVITKYFVDKQFGFLRSPCHEKDIFFHRNKQTIALADMVPGQRVTFTLDLSDPKGPRAVGLVVTDRGHEDAQTGPCVGIILRYCSQQKHGFLKPEGGDNKRGLFFSFVANQGSIHETDLSPGAIVSYRSVQSKDGLAAVDLALIEGID
jgi:cold shock CspA family protein